MAGITVTQTQLAGLTGTSISTARYDAVHAATLRLLRSGYRPDITVAAGRTADVLDAVYTSIAVRLLTNPTGARSLTLGSASVGFGGSDTDIFNPGTLTDAERDDLNSLDVKRKPTFVRFRKISEEAPLGIDAANPPVEVV